MVAAAAGAVVVVVVAEDKLTMVGLRLGLLF